MEEQEHRRGRPGEARAGVGLEGKRLGRAGEDGAMGRWRRRGLGRRASRSRTREEVGVARRAGGVEEELEAATGVEGEQEPAASCPEGRTAGARRRGREAGGEGAREEHGVEVMVVRRVRGWRKEMGSRGEMEGQDGAREEERSACGERSMGAPWEELGCVACGQGNEEERERRKRKGG